MDWEVIKITIFILLYVGISAVVVWKAIGMSDV